MAKAKKAKVIKPTAVPGVNQIKTNTDLYNVALSTALSFADRLPGLMTFEIAAKATWVGSDGKNHKGNFAVLNIYIKGKKSARALIDTLLLGQLNATLGGTQGLNSDAVAGAVAQTINQSITSFLPVVGGELPGVAATPPPAAPSEPTLKDLLAKYKITAFFNGVGITIIEQGGFGFVGGSRSITDSQNFQQITGIDPNSLETITDSDILRAKFGSIINTGKANITSQGLIDLVKQYVQNEKSQTPGTAPSPPAATPKFTALQAQFKDNEPYKYPSTATIYIYQSGRLRGVATGNAFARFYGKTWNGKDDLTKIHPILPMPDLTKFDVPADFFNGAVIT